MELFAGELIAIAPIDAGSEPPATDAVINEKYVRGDIRIVTEQARYPLTAIPGIVENPSYWLSPEYQRRHRWSRERQSDKTRPSPH